MKKLILWLAKKFNVNIEVERIITKEVIEYRYISQGVIEGDVYVHGNLAIDGKLEVSGGLTICKID